MTPPEIWPLVRERYLPVREAARKLRCSPTTLYNQRRRGAALKWQWSFTYPQRILVAVHRRDAA
ncbi:MAG: hypothetical protein ACREOC_16690 [Gemmatimonadales bacterium]